MLALVLVSNIPAAMACDKVTVADTMFKGERDVHPLYVVADRNDLSGAEISERLKTWLEGPGTELNLRVERVFADDPGIRWQAYGMKSAPPELPVVVLATRHAGHIGAKVVDQWHPAPDEKDLDVLLLSPVRNAIREKAPSNMALLVYSPGTDRDSRNMENRLQKMAGKWLDGRTGKKKGKKKVAISILLLNRKDPRERTLVSFAQIPESGSDWLGIFAGPGKMMIPPMKGEQISKKNLTAHLDQLAGKCTCRVDVRGMGVDIPMKWGEQDKAKVPLMKAATGTGRMCKGKHPPDGEPEAAAARCPWKGVRFAALGVLALVVVFVAGVYMGRKRR